MSEVTRLRAPERAPIRHATALGRDYATTLVVALVVFLVAYDGGGFGEQSRDTLAVGLWWVVVLAVGFGLWPLVRTTRAAFVTGGLIAAFALLTLLSTTWASSAEGAYAEFTRVALYLAVFLVAVVAGSRQNAGQWSDGLALGIAAVAVMALVTRLFPYLTSEPEVSTFLSGAKTRLSYPLGYWNGLGIFTAMGIPLLLRIAVAGRSLVVRGLAVAPIPVIAGVIYLTSSRGAVAVAAVGTVAFLVCTTRRWAAGAAALAGAVGSTVAVWVLVDRDTLVNGPLHSAVAESQGRSAALIIGGICVLTALIYAVGCRLVPADLRPSPILGWVTAAAAIALAVAGIAAAHPQQRFEAFKRAPTTGIQGGTVEQHLLSKNGSGRWQLWGAATDEFSSRPVGGTGAGSFHEWWAAHGSIPFFVQDAHSLYLETLGELGIVGFLLLVGIFVSGVAAGFARLVRSGGTERVTLAAIVAAFLGYALGAGIDWMWEMTIVSVVAFACLGLMAGPASAREELPRLAEPGERPPRSRYGLGIATLVGGWLLICAIALPLLAGFKLRASQADAANGNLRGAVKDAAGSRDIEPWAFTPYLQLALLQEDAGNLGAARAAIQKAIRRDHLNWELWLVAARIQTKQGDIAQARRSLKRARTLNPRSPLFSTGQQKGGAKPIGPKLAPGKAARTVADVATGVRLRFVFYDTVGDVPASVAGSEPKAGFRYVAAKLGVANVGKAPYKSNLAQRVTVTDSDGTQHLPLRGGVQPRLGRVMLGARTATVGYLTFSIPESVSLSSIEIQPFGPGRARADISLG